MFCQYYLNVIMFINVILSLSFTSKCTSTFHNTKNLSIHLSYYIYFNVCLHQTFSYGGKCYDSLFFFLTVCIFSIFLFQCSLFLCAYFSFSGLCVLLIYVLLSALCVLLLKEGHSLPLLLTHSWQSRFGSHREQTTL